MKIVNTDNVPKEVSTSPLFVGGTVTSQPIFPVGTSKDFMASQVTFAPGARNQLHTHTTDQILVVTSGRGYVATETEKVEVTVGDVILFPAGEKHWHGATEGSAFSHVYINGATSKSQQVGK